LMLHLVNTDYHLHIMELWKMATNQLEKENFLLSQQDLVKYACLEVTVLLVFPLYVLLEKFATRTA
jgi:hypothetical protein